MRKYLALGHGTNGLIVIQYGDCYIQVKDNEIVNLGSLKGDHTHYIQMTVVCR